MYNLIIEIFRFHIQYVHTFLFIIIDALKVRSFPAVDELPKHHARGAQSSNFALKLYAASTTSGTLLLRSRELRHSRVRPIKQIPKQSRP